MNSEINLEVSNLENHQNYNLTISIENQQVCNSPKIPFKATNVFKRSTRSTFDKVRCRLLDRIDRINNLKLKTEEESNQIDLSWSEMEFASRQLLYLKYNDPSIFICFNCGTTEPVQIRRGPYSQMLGCVTSLCNCDGMKFNKGQVCVNCGFVYRICDLNDL